MRKIAVIDIGSNSIRLDLFRVLGNQITFVDGMGVFNKLGVYLSKTGQIPRKKIDESVAIIKKCQQFALKYRADRVLIFGTSILRKAKNRRSFIGTVKKKCGLQIDVVSGKKESFYVAVSAKAVMRFDKKKALLVDIGGGSTEYIVLNRVKTDFLKSYPYGLSLVKGKFNIQNFDRKNKEAEIRKYFQGRIRLFKKTLGHRQVHRIVATSSVAKAFARVKYASIRKPKDFLRKKITLRDLDRVLDRLVGNPKGWKSLRGREDLVYIGTLFYQTLLDCLGKTHFEVCPYSIREGYLLEYLKHKKQGSH